MKYDMTEIGNGSQVQGVIQEFAIEAVRHQLGIPSNRSPSFSGALIMLPRCLYDSATNLSVIIKQLQLGGYVRRLSKRANEHIFDFTYFRFMTNSFFKNMKKRFSNNHLT